MARQTRITLPKEPTVYHIVSRTALEGTPLGALEKEQLMQIVYKYSQVFFSELIGFCIMGNHFHLLVKILPENMYSDEEILTKLQIIYGDKFKLSQQGLPYYRDKLGNLSEYVKMIKQTFTRYYNKKHERKGYFWGDRFKSVIVEPGMAVLNCLAYIDLNPIRASIVKRPEEYRWSSIGYHIQTSNKNDLLSYNFAHHNWNYTDNNQLVSLYRKFLYEKSGIDKEELGKTNRFLFKSRYFTDSLVLGSKEFIQSSFQKLKPFLNYKKNKKPNNIDGFSGVYSLKKLQKE